MFRPMAAGLARATITRQPVERGERLHQAAPNMLRLPAQRDAKILFIIGTFDVPP
jgi:hypothetical protein